MRFAQTEDPCGKEVDAEIAALEAYTNIKKAPNQVTAVGAFKQAYEMAKAAREACRIRNNMAVQNVEKPPTAFETFLKADAVKLLLVLGTITGFIVLLKRK